MVWCSLPRKLRLLVRLSLPHPQQRVRPGASIKDEAAANYVASRRAKRRLPASAIARHRRWNLADRYHLQVNMREIPIRTGRIKGHEDMSASFDFRLTSESRTV